MRTDPWYPLRYELARSRRYEKPFTLVAGKVAGDGRRLKASVEAYARVLRDTDAVWAHRGQLFILLAETGIGQAEEVIGRLGSALGEPARIAEPRMAAFPEDGLTSAALIDRVLHPERAPERTPEPAAAPAPAEPRTPSLVGNDREVFG